MFRCKAQAPLLALLSHTVLVFPDAQHPRREEEAFPHSRRLPGTPALPSVSHRRSVRDVSSHFTALESEAQRGGGSPEVSRQACGRGGGWSGRWMGCLVQVCARLTPVRAVVAPTQGGLSPPWALVTLLVTQSWGADSVSTLRTESAVSLSAWLCAGPRVLSRCFLGGRMPSQWVPGSARLRAGRGGCKDDGQGPSLQFGPSVLAP